MLSRKCGMYIGALSVFLMMFSLYSVSAFPQNSGGNTDIVINGLTSGANIVIIQHLMEIDQVSNPGYLHVFETIVYKNLGAQNYTGPIYSWADESAFSLSILKMEMSESAPSKQLQYFKVNENVVGWNDTITAGTSRMYRLSYIVPAEPTGKLSETISFTKKMKYPTIVNYEYVPIRNMPVLVIKLTASDEMKTVIADAEGSRLQADSVETFENSNTYNWVSLPSFEITIKMSRSSISGNDIVLYLVIILVVIGVVGYPVMRGKSPALKSFEKKLGRIIPARQDECMEEVENEFEDDGVAGESGEASPASALMDIQNIEQMDSDELEAAEKAISKVCEELDKDYDDGNITEKEYNKIRDRYGKLSADIKKQLEKLEE